MERLVEVVQRLSLARDLESIIAIVRKEARELTGADGATFVLRDGDQCFYVDENAISPLWKGRRFPMNLCISGWVMRHRQAAVIEDVYADPRIPVAVYRPTFVHSLAMVPIRTRDPLGAIGNYWAKPYHPSPEQVRILQALADTTAVAMENVRVYAELEQRVRDRTAALESANAEMRREIAVRQRAEAAVRRLSLTDELTGLHNRRGFFFLAEQQLKLARRTGTLAWLLFADLDGLKAINDTLGHEVGDRLLIQAGQVLRDTFRDTDVVARLGGDEFAVFVIDSSEHLDAIRARLRAAIGKINASRDGPSLSLSVGVAPCVPGAHVSLEALLRQADAAMYAEKRALQAAASLADDFQALESEVTSRTSSPSLVL